MKWLLLSCFVIYWGTQFAQEIPIEIYNPSSKDLVLPSCFLNKGVTQVMGYHQQLKSNGKSKNDSNIYFLINYLPDSNLLTGFYYKNRSNNKKEPSELEVFRNFYDSTGMLRIRLTWKLLDNQKFDSLQPTIPELFDMELYWYDNVHGYLSKKMFYFGMSDFNENVLDKKGPIMALDSLGFLYKYDNLGRILQRTDIDRNKKEISKKFEYNGVKSTETSLYKGEIAEIKIVTSNSDKGITNIEITSGVNNEVKHTTNFDYEYIKDYYVVKTTKDSVLEEEVLYNFQELPLKHIDYRFTPAKDNQYIYNENNIELIDKGKNGKARVEWIKYYNSDKLPVKTVIFNKNHPYQQTSFIYKINQ